MLWKRSIMSIRKEHLFLLLLPFSQTVLTYTPCFSDITAQISFSPSIRHLRKGCGEVSATSSSLFTDLCSWKFTWFLPCSGIAIPSPELLTVHMWLPLPPSAVPLRCSCWTSVSTCAIPHYFHGGPHCQAVWAMMPQAIAKFYHRAHDFFPLFMHFFLICSNTHLRSRCTITRRCLTFLHQNNWSG